jgi:hypothetical protein
MKSVFNHFKKCWSWESQFERSQSYLKTRVMFIYFHFYIESNPLTMNFVIISQAKNYPHLKDDFYSSIVSFFDDLSTHLF